MCPELKEAIASAGLVLPMDLEDRPFVITTLPSAIVGGPSSFGVHIAVQGSPPRGQFLVICNAFLDILFLPYGGTGGDWKCICRSSFADEKYHAIAVGLAEIARSRNCHALIPQISTRPTDAP